MAGERKRDIIPAGDARIEVITEGSPGAVVLVGHDVSGQPLNVPRLEAMGNVHVLLQKGGYGNFTHVDRYLEAADWLDANAVDYDWLENLSGQCYPLRPIAQIEETLGSLSSDGLLLYSAVFPERIPAGTDQGAAGYRVVPPRDAKVRYDYRHWQLGMPSAARDRLIRPLMAINRVQPWARVSGSYFSVGMRRRRSSPTSISRMTVPSGHSTKVSNGSASTGSTLYSSTIRITTIGRRSAGPSAHFAVFVTKERWSASASE